MVKILRILQNITNYYKILQNGGILQIIQNTTHYHITLDLHNSTFLLIHRFVYISYPCYLCGYPNYPLGYP
jgi:hypothetical protein